MKKIDNTPFPPPGIEVYGFDPSSARYAGELYQDISITVTNNHPMGVFIKPNEQNDTDRHSRR